MLCLNIPPRRNKAIVMSFVCIPVAFFGSFASIVILIMIYRVSSGEQELKTRILLFFHCHSRRTQTILLAEEVSNFSAEGSGKAVC